MQNLVLVKYSINTEEDLILISDAIVNLRSYYNISLCLIQRDNNAMISGLPIFCGKEMCEFTDFGLALDMLGAKYMEKASLKKGWLLDHYAEIGVSKFEKIKDLDLLLVNAGVDLNTKEHITNG